MRSLGVGADTQYSLQRLRQSRTFLQKVNFALIYASTLVFERLIESIHLLRYAEIALLNKTAVALAADSAMTDLGTGKIYPANKLFALTKWHPIGVMISNFMGVPWETIIKMYRQMTVEIGFLNKTAVALAADSAMSFLGTGHNSTSLEVSRIESHCN